jgi:glycosyltransferase involved in cell wall biosynthesis
VKSGGISLANLRQARQLMRERRSDLLITYNWGTIEWALANWLAPLAPQIHIEDGFGPDESPQRQNPRRVVMRRLALSRCRVVIVPSRTLYEVATRVWRLSASQVVHLPNGIDCERFARSPDRARLAAVGIDGSGPVIGTVAALRPEKNLARLIRAVAGLPPVLRARLVLVGDGPEREMLRATAEQLGIAERVVFAGAMRDPEAVLGGFDVFGLSSDTEQMPNSILEAMAASLPVVATDVGDLRRMLAPENAPYVVPKEDEAGLSKALLSLIEAPEQRREIGRRNREYVVAQYSLDAMVRRYDALFSGDWDAARRGADAGSVPPHERAA